MTKVFRSPDYNSLLWVFHQLFRRVEATKPPASRNTSAEIFVVCQGFLAPKKLDPKLLDPKYVFKQIDSGKKDAKLPTAKDDKKRKRGGYEEDTALVYKKCTVGEFIASTNPIGVLAGVNQIHFAEEDKEYLNHPFTTTEIVALLEDLKVLGKRDFMRVLKWRTALTGAFKKEDETEVKAEAEAEPEEEDDLEKYHEMLDKKKKKEKKKLLERKRKTLRRIQLGIGSQNDDILQGTHADASNMFKLDEIKGNEGLQAVLDADDVDLEDSDDDFGDAEEEEEEEDDDEDGDVDPDDLYQAELEEDMEALYKRYKEKANKRISFVEKSKVDSDDDEISEHSDEETESLKKGRDNPLIRREELSTEEKTNRWFDDDMYAGIQTENAEDEASDDEDVEYDDDKDISVGIKRKNEDGNIKRESKKAKTSSSATSSSAANQGNGEFEVVPQLEVASGESDSDDEDANNSDTEDEGEINSKIEVLAVATAMLRKKARLSLEDDSWNRYTDNGSEFYPSWYAAEDAKYHKPQIPITKEAAAAIKKRYRELDSRPIKKVAEAKARKKLKKAARLAKAKEKAQAIIKDPDMSVAQKISAAHKTMKKAGDKKKEKVYLVTRQAGGVGKTKPKFHGGSRVKVVDPRMKKDIRAAKNREKTVGRSKKAQSKQKKGR